MAVRQDLTREQLYDLVWQESRLHLAERLGTTAAIITANCKAASVPMPARGYFAKLEAGKPVSRFPLPSRGFGENAVVTFGGESKNRWPPETEEDIPVPVVPEFPEPMDAVLERARSIVSRKPLFKDLRRLHPTLKRAQDAEERRPEWRRRAVGDRERVILNNLIWVLEPLASIKIRIGFNPIYVCLASTTFDIEFVANPLRVKLPIGIEGWSLPTVWADGSQKLEEQVHEIAATLLACAELFYRSNCAWQRACALESRQDLRDKHARERAEQERRRHEEEEKAARVRRERLLEHADNLTRSDKIRSLTKAIEQVYPAEGQPTDIAIWLKMARAEADALDPRLLPVQRLIE